ncbi:MAG: hypothetical protein GYA41_06665 [Bacteroidales bacterium]|nr:hypothetical protein [Bacteroidales bacterium]
MADEAKNNDRKPAGNFMKELLSGIIVSDVIILKNIWYIIMLTVLLAIYIGNRFHAEKITRETSRLSREVRDLRAEALSTSANLMSVSRQSEVSRMVREKGLGLEELKTPAYKLVIDK